MAYIGNQAAVKLEQKQYAECEALCKSAIDVGRANRAPYEDIAKVRYTSNRSINNSTNSGSSSSSSSSSTDVISATDRHASCGSSNSIA
jgi:hypothetical protein